LDDKKVAIASMPGTEAIEEAIPQLRSSTKFSGDHKTPVAKINLVLNPSKKRCRD
jgi:hypothetical protein